VSKKKKSKNDTVAGVVGSTLPDDFDLEEVEKRIVAVADRPVYLRMLVYGNPGTEKTRFIASAVKRENPKTKKPYKVLILDCNEQGTLSVRKFDPTKKYLKVFKVERAQDIEHVFWYLKMRPDSFDIVAIDTTTELQWLFMRSVIDEDARGDASRDILMPHKRDYGKTGEMMRMWISNYRNLPMHIVFTAHESSEDEEDDESKKWPDAQGKVKNRLCAAVDVIGRSYHREVNGKAVPCIYVGPHESWVTKDRSGVLSKEIKRPNLGDIIGAIQESDVLREEQQGKSKKKKKNKKSKK
jgi:hypothetical protein